MGVFVVCSVHALEVRPTQYPCGYGFSPGTSSRTEYGHVVVPVTSISLPNPKRPKVSISKMCNLSTRTPVTYQPSLYTPQGEGVFLASSEDCVRVAQGEGVISAACKRCAKVSTGREEILASARVSHTTPSREQRLPTPLLGHIDNLERPLVKECSVARIGLYRLAVLSCAKRVSRRLGSSPRPGRRRRVFPKWSRLWGYPSFRARAGRSTPARWQPRPHQRRQPAGSFSRG